MCNVSRLNKLNSNNNRAKDNDSDSDSDSDDDVPIKLCQTSILFDFITFHLSNKRLKFTLSQNQNMNITVN